MKKILAVALSLTMLLGIVGLSGCTTSESTTLDASKLVSDYNVEELKGTEINVYNWGEYISDGAEGTMDVVAEFENLTGITVNYTMFDSNEDLYSKLKSGGVSYDVIIPSDYMIERMIKEGMLQKLDFNNIPNYSYIADDYKNLYFD